MQFTPIHWFTEVPDAARRSNGRPLSGARCFHPATLYTAVTRHENNLKHPKTALEAYDSMANFFDEQRLD